MGNAVLFDIYYLLVLFNISSMQLIPNKSPLGDFKASPGKLGNLTGNCSDFLPRYLPANRNFSPFRY